MPHSKGQNVGPRYEKKRVRVEFTPNELVGWLRLNAYTHCVGRFREACAQKTSLAKEQRVLTQEVQTMYVYIQYE